MIRGLSAAEMERLVLARADGAFVSVEDLRARTGLRRATLTRLARADAFGSLELSRREALWSSLPETEEAPLFDEREDEEERVELAALTPFAEVLADYRAQGLSLRDHPLKFLRPDLRKLKAVPAAQLAELPHGRRVKVAGLVLLRQRPGSAKGVTFVTIEDETGQANLIVRPEIWERYRTAARTATLMLVAGDVQNAEGVIHLVVRRIEDASRLLEDFSVRSRDFH